MEGAEHEIPKSTLTVTSAILKRCPSLQDTMAIPFLVFAKPKKKIETFTKSLAWGESEGDLGLLVPGRPTPLVHWCANL